MDIAQIVTNASIVVLCFLVGKACKLSPVIRDEAIPVIVMFVGAILGIVGMFVIPDFPANDILTAMAVGVVSGGASTGVDQIIKQSKK